MDRNDRDEIKEILAEVLEVHAAKMNGKFKLMHQKLITIERQTTKTNGRVTDLEKDTQALREADIEHLLNCPMSDRIKNIEISLIGREAIKKYVKRTAVMTSIIIGAALTVFDLILRYYKL